MSRKKPRRAAAAAVAVPPQHTRPSHHDKITLMTPPTLMVIDETSNVRDDNRSGGHGESAAPRDPRENSYMNVRHEQYQARIGKAMGWEVRQTDIDRCVDASRVSDRSDASDDDCPTPQWSGMRSCLSKWETELMFDEDA
jgi:hypothetical protein